MIWRHPILSPQAASDFEQEWFAATGVSEEAVIERVGVALAAALRRDLGERYRDLQGLQIVTLIGKGHNAADACAAAACLASMIEESQVTVVPRAESMELRQATQKALEALLENQRATLAPSRRLPRLSPREPLLVLDGVFGFNFRPGLAPEDAAFFKDAALLGERGFRASVDLPSGLGDPGSFVADATYATGILKAPVVESGLESVVGRLRYLDIGLFDSGRPQPPDSQWVAAPGIFEAEDRLRPAVSDKRNNGRILIVAGSDTLPGAALLAAEAALVSGAGLVTVATTPRVCIAGASRLPEAMWMPVPAGDGFLEAPALRTLVEDVRRWNVLLAGPGLGKGYRALPPLLRAFRGPVVLDADALQPEVLAVSPPSGERQLVVTPHHGEWARISDNLPPEAGTAMQWSRRTRIVCVLKGPRTWVVDPYSATLSAAGGPILARGGSGDILSGIVARCLGTAKAGTTLVECASRAVAMHGRAADRLASVSGAMHCRITDLLRHLS